MAVGELGRAIDQALGCGATDSEAIRLFIETGRESPVATFSLDGRPHLKTVRVADVDLQAYASLTHAVVTPANPMEARP